MKKSIIRNIILTLVVCTVIGVFIFEKIKDEQLPIDNSRSYELTDEGIIKPELAKELIEKEANKLITALKNKDGETITNYVHPVKGVRFTPYTRVSVEDDVVIKKEDFENFFNDDTIYSWGYYDGIGEEIRLRPREYYSKFVYTIDFSNATEIGYNEVLSSGNMLENQFEIYQNAIIVEYYIPEINPEYEGLDWQSLRLVFEEYEGSWKLVGIIHNQWTI